MSLSKITIVVPIYADWPSIKDCIASLREHAGEPVAKVMLVNDCGPDADILEKNIQLAIKGTKKFEYYRNAKNLGFVGNCNNAVSHLDKTDNDILFLNSDTVVTPGFGEEMIAVLYSSKNIGAVSPRSNNATIATIPLSSIKQKGIGAKQSYKLYQKVKDKLPSYSIVPTAHGFCMLIRRDLIKSYGLFDEVFGRGYGEEVDFCQRIRKAGYKCALANHAYVFHKEARSFSLETKARLLEQNNKIIRKRYPNYQREVQDYIASALIIEEGVRNPSLKGYLKKIRNALSKKSG